MKKAYICALTTLILTLFCVGASANEDVIHIDEHNGYPQTRADDAVSLMSAQEETIEEVITKGWDTLSPAIDISSFKIPKSDFEAVYYGILEENPVYYSQYTLGKASASPSRDGLYLTKIYPEYTCSDASALTEYRQKIDKATEEILFCIDDTMSDFEKVMTVHDYMVLNYEYDTTYQNHSMTIMYTKSGVCQSYAYVFKHMMNMLDIDCTYVSSEVMNHMWNLVKIDGKWYHLDATWNDPTVDRFGQVKHTYALLSTKGILYPSDGNQHYGFSMNGVAADSTKYDKASWRDSIGSIVHCNGSTYWWDDDDLIRDDGKEIVDDVVKSKKWFISNSTYLKSIFAGLAQYDGKLYYNSDKAIYSYNPETNETEKLLDKTGICGLYINKNTLYYTTTYTYSIDGSGSYIGFEKGGEIVLGDTSMGDSYREGDTVVTRICNTAETPITVFVFNGTSAKSQVCENGVSKVEFETETPATIFIWDSNLRPLASKKLVE